MNLDLARLKALASKATPGPWRIGEQAKEAHRVIDAHGFIVADACSTPSLDGRSLRERANDQAAYIAALDPATVIELIRRAERAEELERWYANTSDATATKEPT